MPGWGNRNEPSGISGEDKGTVEKPAWGVGGGGVVQSREKRLEGQRIGQSAHRASSTGSPSLES